MIMTKQVIICFLNVNRVTDTDNENALLKYSIRHKFPTISHLEILTITASGLGNTAIKCILSPYKYCD